MSSWSSTWSSTLTGGRGIQHEPALAAVLADKIERAVDVLGRFGMERDVRRPGSGEARDDAVDRLHHQVHVDVGGDAVIAERLAHQRSHRQVGDVVVVHHVEVNEVGAGFQHRIDLFPETGEIRRQD